MIVGNGQVARVFYGFPFKDYLIFASGVSNSNCTDSEEFKREELTLKKNLYKHPEKCVIYFSSCALSAEKYKFNPYYKHKAKMEGMIKRYANSYFIFRLPQVFGEMTNGNTLISFMYKNIINGNKFQVYDKAYRYVIDVRDVRSLVGAIVTSIGSNITIDLANTYRYKVTDMVTIIEDICGERADYELIERSDSYNLDLSFLQSFIDENNLDFSFGKDYMSSKLAAYI